MRDLGRQLASSALRYRQTLHGRPGPRRPGRRAAPALETPSVRSLDRVASRRRRLEAILFLSREPQPLHRLAKLANLEDATEARTLIRDLGQRYDARGCGFAIASVAGGYQLLTRSKLAAWLEKFAPLADDLRLSPPAMETLAVVAYRQPALRAEVEAIRGVQCGELLRQLMDHDLLRIVGRSEDLGRPLQYGTTARFLRVFGLNDLDSLPSADQLRRR